MKQPRARSRRRAAGTEGAPASLALHARRRVRPHARTQPLRDGVEPLASSGCRALPLQRHATCSRDQNGSSASAARRRRRIRALRCRRDGAMWYCAIRIALRCCAGTSPHPRRTARVSRAPSGGCGRRRNHRSLRPRKRIPWTREARRASRRRRDCRSMRATPNAARRARSSDTRCIGAHRARTARRSRQSVERVHAVQVPQCAVTGGVSGSGRSVAIAREGNASHVARQRRMLAAPAEPGFFERHFSAHAV